MKSTTRILLLVAFSLLMFGCTGCAGLGFDAKQMDEAVGVAPGENAALCITANIDPSFSESSADYARIEGPALTTLKDLTPEQITALATLTPDQITAANGAGAAVKVPCPSQ